MPIGPAARITDMTVHGGPLAPGPPSMNVIIGGLPAWLGLTAAGAAALAATIAAGAKNVADKTAKVAAAGMAGPLAVAKAQADLAEATAKAAADTAAAMTGSGASMNACPIVKLLVPDGIGVVIMPSQTVIINNMGACRVGDMIQEVTSVNAIAMGQMNVIIGG
ncbi:MAG: hypothetical protein KF914_07435 [Rhizobiaceae bacterium]|nr:hypothetical protein [Rhizobiaceae bacterium]